MKKRYRITKNEEFQRILKLRQYVANPVYSVYFAPKRLEESRIGLSVGKKLGGAVERNKIKRQLRMMCIQLTEFNETFDCVIMVRGGYLKQDFEENKKALEYCINKVRIKVRKPSQGELNEKAV